MDAEVARTAAAVAAAVVRSKYSKARLEICPSYSVVFELNRRTYWFGTINATWQATVYDEVSQEVLDSLETWVSSECDDGILIGQAILRVMEQNE